MQIGTTTAQDAYEPLPLINDPNPPAFSLDQEQDSRSKIFNEQFQTFAGNFEKESGEVSGGSKQILADEFLKNTLNELSQEKVERVENDNLASMFD
jgi:hypothetical protein